MAWTAYRSCTSLAQAEIAARVGFSIWWEERQQVSKRHPHPQLPPHTHRHTSTQPWSAGAAAARGHATPPPPRPRGRHDGTGGRPRVAPSAVSRRVDPPLPDGRRTDRLPRRCAAAVAVAVHVQIHPSRRLPAGHASTTLPPTPPPPPSAPSLASPPGTPSRAWPTGGGRHERLSATRPSRDAISRRGNRAGRGGGWHHAAWEGAAEAAAGGAPSRAPRLDPRGGIAVPSGLEVR